MFRRDPDVKEQAQMWKEMYDSTEPHRFIPRGKFASVDGLEKLVVVRCIRPDKVVPGIQVGSFLCTNLCLISSYKRFL